MRRELKSLQQRVNITVIFVTHDQIEALSLSDRIAIMKFGVLEQVGTAEEVYYHPGDGFRCATSWERHSPCRVKSAGCQINR